MSQGTLREEVEAFLYMEAGLLDGWRLEDWLKLFTDDATYVVPPTDAPAADPADTLFLIDDDRFRLGERVKRLLKRQAHAEFPHSRTQHSIGNVRILRSDASGVDVECHFTVYRSRRGVLDVFPGMARYELVRAPDGALRIRAKRAVLTLDVLRPQGKLSIIL